MMAAEPSIDNTADVSDSPNPRSESDAQHGNLQPPTINGAPAAPEDIANKRITSVEDQITSADVSVSGGSDTEASRAEWAKQKEGDGSNGRAGSSTKKPATFKAVSVNKTFLAAKSSSPGLSSKTGDKSAAGSSTPPTGSAALSISRPRLVAKTGTGTGGSSPRFSSLANGRAGAAPDPAAVWNKNRPTPAPEPRKLTDEDLKKFGIHVASRLNAEEAQGQNKWADIEDDDEDWAPEAITWGDGTKTTLPHTDEPPPPPPPSIPPVDTVIPANAAAAQDNKQPAPAHARVHAPVQILGAQTSASAPKTSGLPSGKGLILKSATQEKPILVAKPPAPPTPAKSPWAPLPPVDKVPPGSFEPPYAARGLQREHPSMRSNVPPFAREGVDDDFNRSTWRERAPPGNRELFNSRSGRYEPVVERHAPPMRSDSLTRHPALLQRASQMDQPEPSPAFQTSRTAQDIPFGRRRGSSNVSGGSGSFLQRMGKPHDGAIPPPEVFLEARRSSHAGSVEGPISPAVLSAHSQQRPDWASRPSPRASFAVPHRGPPSVDYHAGPPSTGPPPGGPPLGPAAQVPAPPMEDDIQYQKKLMREGVELARKRRQEEEAREEAARRERIQKKLDALGPAPERKSDTKENTLRPPVQIQQRVQSSTSAETPQLPSKQEEPKKAEASTAIQEPQPPNALPPSHAPRRPSSNGQELKPTGSSWPGSGPRPDRFSSWVSGTPRNVWGSPDNNDRGLGNGTFNPDLGRVPGSTVQQPHSNATPSPIAPPSAQPGPQTRPQAPSANLGLRSSRFATTEASTTGTELANKWVAAVAENDQKMSAQRLAERAGREKLLAERGMSLEDAQPTIKDTWRPVHVPGDGTRHGMGTVEIQSHPQGPWKAPRDDFSRDQVSHLAEDTTAVPSPGVIGGGAGSSVLSPPGAAGNPQSRPSRFFPAKDARADASQVSGSTRPSSPSPPPPTMEGHPVYEGGDVYHPHVSLPKPHPVVKLPPPLATAQSPQPNVNNVWAARAALRDGQRGPGQQGQGGRPGIESSSCGNWQDKINSLLNGGGKGQLPKHALIDAASKTALDQTLSSDAATTVVLPSTIKTYSWEDAKSSTTKPMAEECFEEQEMGSLPQIRFPHKAPEAAWQPAVIHNKPLPKKFVVEAMGKEPFHFAADVIGNGNAVVIKFQGMAKPKVLTVPFPSSRGGRGGHGRPAPRHRGGSAHGPRGGKRDASSTYPDPESSRPTGRGGRGYRMRGGAGGGAGAAGERGSGSGGGDRGSDSWSRYPSSQKQTSMPA